MISVAVVGGMLTGSVLTGSAVKSGVIKSGVIKSGVIKSGVVARGRAPARDSPWALVSAALLPAVLIGGWLLADAVQPARYSPVRQTVSVTAGMAGTDRWIETSALTVAAALYVLVAMGAASLSPLARLGLVLTGAAAAGVAACPQPMHGSTDHHLAFATLGAVLLAGWPLLAARRAPLTWAETLPVAVAASLAFVASLGWLAFEAFFGRRVGLAERVSTSVEVWWPLVVLSAGHRSRVVRRCCAGWAAPGSR